jgi:phage-related protein
MISKLGGGIINEIPNLLARLPQVVIAAVNTLLEEGKRMLGVGVNFVEGLWNGIATKIDWIIGKVKEFAANILNGIKAALGIHSPSTEGSWIGSMFSAGVAEGMMSGVKNVKKAVEGINDIILAIAKNESPKVNIVAGISYSKDIAGKIESGINVNAHTKDTFDYERLADILAEKMRNMSVVVNDRELKRTIGALT